MFLKYQSKDFASLKQELLIMQVPKSGKISLITKNLTYGPWDAYYMK